jgi:hypothetical protein|nr:MAG: hypothetical protein [Caudoviricetes sp.]
MNKNEMISLLNEHVCTVTFTKVSGDSRVMKCTLRDDTIPESTHSRTLSDDLIAAFDIENSGWRSFHVSSVTDFTF